MQRESIEFDVVIIGAGPAGLSAAIRIKQLASEAGRDISVCVLEKGSSVGAHILSGAVLDPRALNELLPEWQSPGGPSHTPVTHEHLAWLTADSSRAIPTWSQPKLMHNDGCSVISLGELCTWLGEQAEALGVEIYAGFSAVDLIYNEHNQVAGVITGDMGRDAQGNETPQFAAGIELRAAYTLIAEGTRGSLTRVAEEHYALRAGVSPQKYGLGIKEVWRVSADKHQPGRVQHTLGWPLQDDTGGGSFVYHYGDGLVAIGFVVHLDYTNPYIAPFDEFQRFKTHPHIRPLLEGATRLSYGARAISEGGLQSLPKLVFPGGALLGCSAGLVNVPRIKGIHNAMKSGMLAAEAVASALAQNRKHDELLDYPQNLQQSWVWAELDLVRNVKPWLSRLGTRGGTLAGGIEMWLASFGLRMPWTLRHQSSDHDSLEAAKNFTPIDYPKPDDIVSFDRLTSLALANISHDDRQPAHLTLRDQSTPISLNLARYAAPEVRYCPAGVYEINQINDQPQLKINAQNCIHCKTCDIKDMSQNIRWVPPEGGSGPNYGLM